MNIPQTLTFAVSFCLIGLCVTAQEPEAPAEPNPVKESSAIQQQAAKLLEEARRKISSHKSVRASISEKIAIQNYSFIARGSYLQGRNLQLRTEFSVELGSVKGSLLEVCDGQVLWTRYDVADQSQITRRDVREILAAVEKSGGRIPLANLVTDLGLGGLPSLLASISQDFEFTKVTDAKIDNRAVTVLEGAWSNTYRDQWLGGKEARKKNDKLPYFFPDLIRLTLDQESLFPRRIVYYKQLPDGTANESNPLLTIDFTKVVFDQKIREDEEFVFVPSDRTPYQDITKEYLNMLQAPVEGPAPPADTKAKKSAE